MSSVETQNALPSKPGPLNRFKAAENRTTKLKDTLERFKQNQLLENDFRTHIPEPYGLPLKPVHVSLFD